MEFDFIPFICSLQPESEFTIRTLVHREFTKDTVNSFLFEREKASEGKREKKVKEERKRKVEATIEAI